MNDITKIKVDGEPESSYQLYPRNEEFAKRAGGNTGSQSGVQPDWNQNDETAPDYIKNRPFYTDGPVETVLLEETTAEFTEVNGGYSYELSNPLSLEVGQTYQVTWDGTVYECIGTVLDRDTILGNLSIVNAGEDTGEPFIYGFAEFFTKDTSASHTISISVYVPRIIKIDEKYLPELPYMDKKSPTAIGSFSLNRQRNTIVGENSFAEGQNTTASGDISHAEGENTTASGRISHSEGHFTTASGFFSHAEGENTIASGYTSHAEGVETIASGRISHAEGSNTKASSEYQHVQGRFNIEDSSDTYAHIVGNGTSDTARSNAHTLDWSGNAWYAGTIEGKALILPSSTENSTKKFKITVDDNGALTATEVT